MAYVGESGKIYEAGELIAEGGEGRIYRIKGNPANVLKVLKDERCTVTKCNKILAMYKNQPDEDFRKQVAWPIDVIYDGSKFSGYVMPYIKGESIWSIYKTSSSIEEYGNKTNLFVRINIAKNLCAALQVVHEKGYVVGDLNNKNILINDRFVTLIDADSFHMRIGNRLYRCEVGQENYIPPELQDMNLQIEKETFTQYSDLFALAVHVFALLMNGWHPFSCAVLSTTESSIVKPRCNENIRSGFFPFYQHRDHFTIPRLAPSFDVLPEEIRKLFVQAFVEGHRDPSKRPNEAMWLTALNNMQKSREYESMALRIRRETH